MEKIKLKRFIIKFIVWVILMVLWSVINQYNKLPSESVVFIIVMITVLVFSYKTKNEKDSLNNNDKTKLDN